jgi:peptide/nickel transport system substrate-binding protein
VPEAAPKAMTLDRMTRLLRCLGPVAATLALIGAATGNELRHAIAMHGAPAYESGFTHFRYVNPDAPKGGRLTQAFVGTFDSLNPLIVRGNAFQQMRGYVIESLLARGYDEPFTLYGLLAEFVSTDDARTHVVFQLNPKARFSDGKPVSVEDVLFSWRLLRDKGRPNHRGYYSKVSRAEKIDERTVRFDFGGEPDRELPLILGLMPILPRHAIDEERFDQTTLEPMLGSGPYRVAEVRAGESILLKRDTDYWGRDLAVNRGLYNFDEMRFDFFRDGNSWFEAFKRGLYDIRFETDPGRWAQQYDFPAARERGLVREGIVSGQPKPLQTFVFNTRRALFADQRVRAALIELFDFEWANANLYHGAYQRTASYFEGSELSARGRPADARERTLLASFENAVRPEIMDGTYQPPVSDGSGRDRARLKAALELFAEAGFALRGGVLVGPQKTPMSFEIMIATKDDERLALAYASMLRRAGVAARIRFVDGAQFEQRRQNYDFDMMPYVWQQSLSPGNEQAFYFGSDAADVPGTRNYMGAKNPAVDAMIAALLAARGRPEFVSAVRALDRVLMSGQYVMPLFHLPEEWIARWPEIARPADLSLYGTPPETWWRRRAQ